MNKCRCVLPVLLLTCCVGQEVLAVNKYKQQVDSYSSLIQQLPVFKLQPRASIWGMTGDYTLTKGQALMPLLGDQNRVLYALLEGNFVVHDNTWFAGAGLGYRQIINDCIYGGYFITDYNKSINKNGVLIANPGLEMLGKKWDVNFNVYLPFNGSKELISEDWYGDGLKIYDYMRLTGHKQYDHRRQEFEQAARGVDIKVGRVIPHFSRAKVYLGGYYYSTKDLGDIKGVTAKISYELNKYTALELTNTYDNYNYNKLMFGVKLTLGGYSREEKKDFGMSARLLDTVDHGYGSTIVPFKKDYIDKGEFLQHDNVWFIKTLPKTTANSLQNKIKIVQGNGTAENPFIDLTTENYQLIANNSGIGTIDKYPLVYLASGTYSLAPFSGPDGLSSKFVVPAGWGLYGRNATYARPAQGTERPVLIGGLDFVWDIGANASSNTTGGNNVIDSIVLRETGEADRGDAIVRMQNVTNVVMRNVKIGADSMANGGYFAGIAMDNATVILYDTNVYGVVESQYSNAAYGINAINNSTINFAGGTNSVTGISFSTLAYGIKTEGNCVVNFIKGTNVVNALNFDADNNGFFDHAYGIMAAGKTTINFLDGMNVINASGTSFGYVPDTSVTGMHAFNNSVINFKGGENYVSAVASSFASVGGRASATAAGITSYNSQINFLEGINSVSATGFVDGSRTDAYSTGIAVSNSNINFVNRTNTIQASINGTGQGDSVNGAIGIDLRNSIINFNNGGGRVMADVYGDAIIKRVSGIYADHSSQFVINNLNQIDLMGMPSYVDIVRNSASSYTTGYKIRWTGHGNLLWL